MKKNLLPAIALLLLTLITSSITRAQIVSGNVFLKGKYIEVGIAPNQQFGTNVAAPAGYNPRGWGAYPANALGFVSDPAMDGWSIGTPNYIGCYFLPGTPQEGWDMSINSTWFRCYANVFPYGTDMAISPAGGYTFTGAVTDHYYVGDEVFGKWEGNINDLEITTTTHFDTNSIFFIIDVKLKNTGTTTYEDIYYSRTLDPDNESIMSPPAVGGGPTTTNVIEMQPDALTGDFRALVSATGLNYPTFSYLGIGAVDCRATVYIRTATTSGGSILFPGTGPHHVIGSTDYNKNVGFNNSTDCAVGIIFDIGDLAPGDSTKFSYAYVLNADYLDSAFATLAPNFEIDGGAVGDKDSIYACTGDTIDISVVGGEDFYWEDWFPLEGLVFPSGRSNRVVVGDTAITYSIIGNGINCPISDTLTITVVPREPVNTGTDSTIQMCGNADPINLLSVLGGSPEPGGVWSGPGVTPGGILNPAGMAEGTYVYIYTATDGECSNTSQVTVQIVNDVDLDFDFVIAPGCDGDSVQFTNLTDSLTYFRWNFGDGSAHDTSNSDPLHIYEDQGEYGVWFVGINNRGCIDSLLKLVNTAHPLNAAYTQSNDSLCQSGPNLVAFFDGSVGNIVSWSWDFGDGGTSTLQNPTHTYTDSGMHTVRLIITEDIGCHDTAYSTVYVAPTPYLEISIDRDSICRGEMIRVNADYLYTATDITWDFGDGSVIHSLDESKSHSYGDAGLYVIRVTSVHPVCAVDGEGLVAMDSVWVKPYPQINLGSDTALCLKGSPIYLDPATLVSNPAGTVYYWSTGDSTSLLKITEPGVYRVTADLDGCLTSDEIEVNKDCYADIPNTFTPNGDGNNDYFFPRQLLSEGIIDFRMVIYNRWGEEIFETTRTDGKGWDGRLNGKDQPVGVYVYQISIRYKNQAAEKYTGNVTLLR